MGNRILLSSQKWYAIPSQCNDYSELSQLF